MLLRLSLLTIILGLSSASPAGPPKLSSTLCAALATSSDYMECRGDWAAYNACKCFNLSDDAGKECKKMEQIAVRFAALHHILYQIMTDGSTQIDCQEKCRAKNSGCHRETLPTTLDVCKVGHFGTSFVKCAHTWALYNACICWFEKNAEGWPRCANYVAEAVSKLLLMQLILLTKRTGQMRL